MGGSWPYSCWFVGCCFYDLFNIARSILVLLPSSFFHSFSVVHQHSSIDSTAAWKKLRFISSIRSDLHMTDCLSIDVHDFASLVSMSVSVDETLLPRKVNLSTSFRDLSFSVEMSPVWLKHIYSGWCALTCLQRLIPDYVAGFQLGRMYLPEVLCHRRSQRP